MHLGNNVKGPIYLESLIKRRNRTLEADGSIPFSSNSLQLHIAEFNVRIQKRLRHIAREREQSFNIDDILI